jgi:hypothetical protein
LQDSHPPVPGLEQFGYRQQLRRVLSTGDLIIYGLIFMVPIAPFGVYGFVWNDARGMVPLAYLVGLVGMFFTAMSYAAMSRAFPVAGSVYTYAQRGLSDIAGFFAGWLILLDYILVPALLYLFSAIALKPLLPAVPQWIWLVSFVAFNAAVNLIGIEFGARANRYMLAIELVVLALFVVLGLVALYGGHGAGRLTLKPVYDPGVFSIATVAGATSIAAADLDRHRSVAGHAVLLSRHGVLRNRARRRRGLAGAHHPSRCGARIRHRQRNGGAGGHRTHPVCDGARSQTAGRAGKSSPALPDPVCEHAAGRRGVAAGRSVVRQPGR